MIDEPEPKKSIAPRVQCRAKGAWLGVAFFGFMGCLAWSLLWLKPNKPSPDCPPTPQCSGWSNTHDLLFVGSVALLFWLVALNFYLSIRCDETTADEHGLTIKTFWRKRYFAWPEISDFYLLRMDWHCIVVNGKVIKLTPFRRPSVEQGVRKHRKPRLSPKYRHLSRASRYRP